MMLRLGNGEWFECQAEVPRQGIAVGKVELRVTGARDRALASILIEPHEAGQLVLALSDACRELEEP